MGGALTHAHMLQHNHGIFKDKMPAWGTSMIKARNYMDACGHGAGRA